MIIAFKSRYGDDRSLKEVEPGVFTYVTTENMHYCRYGYEEDGSVSFVDPEGGPFIEVGYVIWYNKKQYRITKIEITKKWGTTFYIDKISDKE
jgi:hypothetical protein